MAKILKGAPVATAIVENIGKRVEALKAKGCEPTLAIVRVGARSDDLAYERGATKRAEKCGIRVRVFELDETCAQSELEDTLDQIMADDTIHGCLLFRPLPRRFNEVAAAHLVECCYLTNEHDTVDAVLIANVRATHITIRLLATKQILSASSLN